MSCLGWRFLALCAAGVLGAAQAQPDGGATPWGVAVGHDSGWSPGQWAPQIAATGVHTVRGFADYPDTFAVLQQNGFQASGILQWSPAGRPPAFPASDLNGWSNYVHEIVTRYAGRVRAWEVWNEPPNFSADASSRSYAGIFQVAADSARSASPGVRIGLTAKSAHLKFLAEAIDAGAAGRYDYITLHPYETASYVRQGWERQFMGIVPTVRKMLREKDPGRAGVPIEFTEIGTPANWPNRTFPYAVSLAEQADLLVKYYTMSLAQGVARVSWFEAWDGDSPDPATSDAPFGLIKRDGTRRLAYTALKTLVGSLGQMPRYLGWADLGGAGYGFIFSVDRDGPPSTAMVIWARPGPQTQLNFAEPVRVVAPTEGIERAVVSSTVQLRASPRILLAQPGAVAATWRQQAEASRTRPFGAPEGAAVSDSVSLVAGQPDQGLLLADKPAPVTVNGVQAYPMSGRSRAVFAVDPSFLSWTAQRITVTAVLHRLGSGGAGFNLKYESTAPLSAVDGNGLSQGPSCWCQVPPGGARTLTWVIDNPRFVGMFGYNFVLDSDSPQYSNYAIERITVTKTP